jgi:flagellar biosynthesis/type III secretory pathway protein FliH
MVKLLDFADRLDELGRSENPFATIIAAHLVTMRTSDDPEDRCQWKLRLLRPLYQRGMSQNDVRNLFRVLDWMMDLPTDIAVRFDIELRKIEQEYEMPYVTSIERRATEQGRKQGRKQGREQGRKQGVQDGLLAGQIQLLQRLLEHPEASLDELLKRPAEKLQVELQLLQAEFTDRQKGN